jgi:pyruvate kinase
LNTNIAKSGDTLVVVSGMMTELDGIGTSNMLKVHVAAETLVAGTSVVDGLVTGDLHRLENGNLDAVPDGSVVAVPADYDGELVGEADGVRGIVDGHSGTKSHAAVLARELDIPMISGATVPDDVENGAVVTLDADRGVLYRDAVGRRRR